MSRIGAAPRAAVPAPGAPRRAAAPVSNARAEASRRNGAKSRGPRTPEGKARSSKNALKHGLRAHKNVVLPQEDAAEFAALEAALITELAPVGALQTVLAQRIAVAAWRLARADRMEAEVLEFRSYEGADLGLALMRDGNGTRSFETLMRYRSAAMAEFMRSLRTLQALQAERREAEANLATPAAPPPKPKEPKKVHNKNDLDWDEASTAAVRLTSGARDSAHAGPERCDPSARTFGRSSTSRLPAPPPTAKRTQESVLRQ